MNIKSSKVSLKFCNKNKLQTLSLIIDEYKGVVQEYVNLLWTRDKIDSLLDKDTISQVSTWLSARLKQCAGKQASGIVRGTKTKIEKTKFIISKLNKEGKFKQERKLQAKLNKTNISCPIIKNIQMELDERFINKDFNNKTKFDGWINLNSIGHKIKLKLPIKFNKHFNELNLKGQITKGIRISKDKITFMFKLKDHKIKEEGSVLGIDIGKLTTVSCSNGTISNKDNHGYDLNSIIDKLSKKVKGSKAFKRVQEQRTNYINWSINRLDLTNIKQINIEKIKNLRLGKRSNRKLSHWTYRNIIDKLKDHALTQGVLVNEVDPAYTSQRCSCCGWVLKKNRNGKKFNCLKCNFNYDSDLNAAVNISLNLRPIGTKERLKQNNRIGFYWNVLEKEPIVPLTQKNNCNFQYN